jgi:hypothetical protein
MGSKLGGLGLITLLVLGLELGCHKSAVQHKEPPDPLLVTKKPVEGRPRPAEGADTVYREPPPPPIPSREPFPLTVRGESPGPALLGIEPVDSTRPQR